MAVIVIQYMKFKSNCNLIKKIKYLTPGLIPIEQ